MHLLEKLPINPNSIKEARIKMLTAEEKNTCFAARKY